MCPYFKYVNIVNSKINSVNLITENNDELNLMYSKIENNKCQINNIFINDSIEHIKIIKNFINDKFDFYVNVINVLEHGLILKIFMVQNMDF